MTGLKVGSIRSQEEIRQKKDNHGFDCLTVATVAANPSLMLTGNVSLYKHLKVSKPQFPHLFNGVNNTPHRAGRRLLNEVPSDAK